jgi:hypothetical protein
MLGTRAPKNANTPQPNRAISCVQPSRTNPGWESIGSIKMAHARRNIGGIIRKAAATEALSHAISRTKPMMTASAMSTVGPP